MPKGIYLRKPRKRNEVRDNWIARLYAKGWSQQQLAEFFETNRMQIRKSLHATSTAIRPPHFVGTGENNPAWRGGRLVDSDGYVHIRCPNHPQATCHGYVLEHRLVVEAAIERYLTKQEIVHHRNGIKSDNRLENLILFASNGNHLAVELLGKCPKWTEEGKKKIAARKAPSMSGIPHCKRGTGARQSRRKILQKFLHDTSDLSDIELVAELPPMPPAYHRPTKPRETKSQSSSDP